jgi:hypothetical protein
MPPHPTTELEVKQFLNDLLTQFQTNPENLQINEVWNLLNLQIKKLSNFRVGADLSDNLLIQDQVDRLLDDLHPFFFRQWAKTEKIPPNSFKSFLECVKIQHELQTYKSNGAFTFTHLEAMKMRMKGCSDVFKSFKIDQSNEFFIHAIEMFKRRMETNGWDLLI